MVVGQGLPAFTTERQPAQDAPATDMRNASFIYTEQQVINETKDVTRRMNWLWARPGMRIQACQKCQGRKKGEPLVKLKVIEIVDVRREPLNALTRTDIVYYSPEAAKREVVREGFPDMTPEEFVKMFCSHMKCDPNDFVTRVEFKYV
jgi:hypothetical protein